MIFGFNEVYFALFVGILALLYSAFLVFKVVRSPKGNEKMQGIAKAIEEGANAYLMRQYKTLVPIVIILAALIYYFVNADTAIAFVVGVLSSAFAGYVGMQAAVKGNVRVANAANAGLGAALSLAFKGGAVTGMALVGFGLIGLSGLYIAFNGNLAPLVGYGFGASLLSLFARVGGGIYTKAADVGADLAYRKNRKEHSRRRPEESGGDCRQCRRQCRGLRRHGRGCF